MVIASTVKRLTATNPYLNNGNSRQSKGPCSQALCQKVDVAKGKLKQQNIKSDTDKFIMKTAVAFLNCKEKNVCKNQIF